jgi:hypothetical protein
MNNETPETDNHPSRWQEGNIAEFIHADFARKLERERDEARESLKEAGRLFKGLMKLRVPAQWYAVHQLVSQWLKRNDSSGFIKPLKDPPKPPASRLIPPHGPPPKQ